MKEIKSKNGFSILVDDDDYEYLNQWKWSAKKERNSIYAISSQKINGKFKSIRMHRILMDNPKSMIDHKDCNGLNNQKSNLRLTDYIKNGQNRRPNKGHKYKGVIKKGHKYISNIQVNNKRVYIGTFKTEEDAAIAYNKAADKYFQENSRINIIDKLPISYKIMSLV